MKNTRLSLEGKFLTMGLLLAVLLAWQWLPMPRPAGSQPVNPVLGDASYVARFGALPTGASDEDSRIQTHLAYAEAYLRAHTPAELPPAQRQRRTHLLCLLRTYWQAGVFPRNYDYANERRPCFIDRTGRICAVGYLVEQTAGRAAAEAVNQRHQYDEVLAMHDATLNQWAAGNGLSVRECAMIQPTYQGPVVGGNSIEAGYGISSAVLSGFNVTALMLNRPASLPQGREGRFLPALAVMSGAVQIVVGATNFPKVVEVSPGFNRYPPTVEQNQSQTILSIANIGLGTATLLLGTWNLLHKPTAAPAARTSWNVGPAPAAPGQLAGGASLYLTRRL